jgi:multiple sugar transport system permease protein
MTANVEIVEPRTVARQPLSTPRRSGMRRPKALTTALIWICTAYFVIPLLWLVVASTKSNADLFSTFGLWFAGEISFLDNLRTVFAYKDGLFGRWMLNSAFYSGVAAVGAAFFATMAGYAFATYRFRGDKLLFAIALGAIMIPATALALPQFVLASAYQLTNSPLAVILPALASPVGVFIMRVYAKDAIPDSLIEAARVDGAGELRIFFTIALRLLGPGLVTVLLFSLVGAWNNYLLPLLMIRSEELYPVTVGLAQLNAQSAGGGGATVVFSTVITGSLLSVIPLIIAFAYLQRYWQSGLTTGSVKA